MFGCLPHLMVSKNSLSFEPTNRFNKMGKKKLNDLSALGGLVYSTDPDAVSSSMEEEDVSYPDPSDQKLYVSLDRKNRKGKAVTLIEGFEGSEDDFSQLSRELKVLCGAGGNAKDGEIIVQGDFRNKIIPFLEKKGYKVVKKGG
jgi:translation initiation factor 1